MNIENLEKIQNKLDGDIMRAEVKYLTFCDEIKSRSDENPQRADKLINSANTQYNTIQHIYEKIKKLINKII
jgi:hypothetical protein